MNRSTEILNFIEKHRVSIAETNDQSKTTSIHWWKETTGATKDKDRIYICFETKGIDLADCVNNAINGQAQKIYPK